MFVIRTVASLGDITAVRVWHYNLGPHPKWSVGLIAALALSNTVFVTVVNCFTPYLMMFVCLFVFILGLFGVFVCVRAL